ncbi:unnamed protein product, partial [Ectocarpus fasciculatus]
SLSSSSNNNTREPNLPHHPLVSYGSPRPYNRSHDADFQFVRRVVEWPWLQSLLYPLSLASLTKELRSGQGEFPCSVSLVAQRETGSFIRPATLTYTHEQALGFYQVPRKKRLAFTRYHERRGKTLCMD